MNLASCGRLKTPHLRSAVTVTSSVIVSITIFQYLATAAANPKITKLKYDCRKLSAKSDCECISLLSVIQIKCPANHPKITVEIRPGEHVMINCSNISYGDGDYKLMPNMNIGETAKVEIQDCPIPGHLSVASIPQLLGVTKFTTLFTNDYNDLVTNITRENLSGLHDLKKLGIKARHLSPDSFTDISLRNLTWICLGFTNELPMHIFSRLENLIFINLEYNHLKSLPIRIFRNQKKLQKLKLSTNKLRNLTKDTFEGLTSLTELDLSNNSIETFQHDVLDHLLNLGIVILNDNRFHSLPQGLFKNNPKLEIISLVDNQVPLRNLPGGFLANLYYLVEVYLFSGLESVPADLFANSTGLKTVWISNNKLDTLPAELFKSQVNLDNLYLSHNQLKYLPDDLFRYTESLIILMLDHNQLTEISGALFKSLINLHSLDISNNRLINLHVNAFAFCHFIADINLENNRLILVSQFNEANALIKLNLKNNSIRHIQRDWTYFWQLSMLDLSYNTISSLSADDLIFTSIDYLRLNLTHNQVRLVNFENVDLLIKVGGILDMDLNDNPLQCDCSGQSFLKFQRGEIGQSLMHQINIDTKNLKCSSPENLRGQLVSTVDLMDLLCPFGHDGSNRTQCPRGCNCWERSYDRILIVNCSNGHMTSIPDLPLVEQHQLIGTELHIENNELIMFPSASTPGYADVLKIFAAGNNLTSIESSQLPVNLIHLDVRYNNMEYFNESTINFLNKSRTIKSISLSGNPWICDCETKPLLMFVRKNNRMITDVENMTCSKIHSVKYINGLVPTDICSDNDNEQYYITCIIIILLFSLLMVSVAALYYKYQKEIMIWLYAHNWCMCLVTERELDKDKKYDAFISYSHKDEQFIGEHLVPQLENGTRPFKLCVHVRDWLVGECIPDQIVRSIEDSRRTIVVVSQNFIDSVWARVEFKTAHQASLTEGRARVIVIIYGDIGNIDNLDSDLKAYLKMNTYLKWGDPWFWDKLRYAMPHRVKNDPKGLIDVQLEIRNTTPATPTLTTQSAEATTLLL